MAPEPQPAASAHWLNPTVLGIGLASLFSDIGHEMATAAMPAFLASLGANAAMLGLIEGLADGASSFAKLLSGLYSDKLARRKPIAVVGYTITALAMGSFALAASWWDVLAGRVTGWIARGARGPVRNVLMADATTPATYGRAFGFERSMDSVGAFIGPVIALILVGIIGFRGVFAVSLIPGLIAALLIGTLVRERPHPVRPQARLFSSMAALPRPFRRFLIGVGIAGVGDFSNTLLILWATQAWTPAYGIARAAQLAMLFYVGYNAVYAASCYGFGMLADRFPKRHVLAAGYALAIVPAIALMTPGASLLKFAVVFAMSGVYMGGWETVESSAAAESIPAELRGTGFGVLATVNGIGDFLSSTIVGLLWTIHPHLAMSFVIAAALFGSAIVAANRPE
ncbi:MAG: MFS transporter [Candidatus Binataceae bacterium]